MGVGSDQRVHEETERDAGHHQTAGIPWAFNESVTAVFEDMLRRSIPQYDVMRKAVFDVGARFVTPHSDVVDLGSSRGDAIAPFIDRFGAHNRFTLVEVSEPMLAVLHERFGGFERAGVVTIAPRDLTESYPPVSASLTLAVLTLMFVPIEYRMSVVHRIAAHTRPGGALIVVEKVLGATAVSQALLVDVYHARKREQGYSQEEIDRKALALRGALVPMAADWNEMMLRSSGFATVECVWRWMNFAAWVAIR